MPINIHKKGKEGNIAWLCEEEWSLTAQVYELEKWLNHNLTLFKEGKHIADIGYIGQRNTTDGGGVGGGGVMTVEFMKILISVDMEVWLSEYPIE